MPLLVLLLVLAVVLGLFTTRRTATATTTAAAVLVLLAFIWAVLDGKGDDPAWLIAVALAVSAGAIWLADRLADVRSRAAAGRR